MRGRRWTACCFGSGPSPPPPIRELARYFRVLGRVCALGRPWIGWVDNGSRVFRMHFLGFAAPQNSSFSGRAWDMHGSVRAPSLGRRRSGLGFDPWLAQPGWQPRTRLCANSDITSLYYRTVACAVRAMHVRVGAPVLGQSLQGRGLHLRGSISPPAQCSMHVVLY